MADHSKKDINTGRNHRYIFDVDIEEDNLINIYCVPSAKHDLVSFVAGILEFYLKKKDLNVMLGKNI